MRKSIIIFLISLVTISCVIHARTTLSNDQVTLTDSNHQRPNIILILLDDLGYGQLGMTSQHRFLTPNIDNIAKEGIFFTQAYSGGPVCSPSRVSLMTGRDSRMLHGKNNKIKLRGKDITFAKLLQNSGYHTKLIGKWGIGARIGYNDPLEMGFDTYMGFLKNIPAHRQYPTQLFRNNQVELIKENTLGKKVVYAQELFTKEAIKFIKQRHDMPFLLYLAYTSPHAELAVPEKFLKPFRNKFKERPYLGLTDGTKDSPYERYYPEAVAEPNATMAGMVYAIDNYIGQIMSSLYETEMHKNTLVIITSDNGPHEAGGADPIYMRASAPYRGIKRDLLDGGIHVPMIAHWPALIKTSRIDSTPLSFADILPTFAELARIELKNHQNVKTNGVSIAKLLTDLPNKTPERIIYWEFKTALLKNKSLLYQAARKGHWKAVRYGVNSKLELYNINSDPGEFKDLAEVNFKRTTEFRELFDRMVRNNTVKETN